MLCSYGLRIWSSASLWDSTRSTFFTPSSNHFSFIFSENNLISSLLRHCCSRRSSHSIYSIHAPWSGSECQIRWKSGDWIQDCCIFQQTHVSITCSIHLSVDGCMWYESSKICDIGVCIYYFLPLGFISNNMTVRINGSCNIRLSSMSLCWFWLCSL